MASLVRRLLAAVVVAGVGAVGASGQAPPLRLPDGTAFATAPVSAEGPAGGVKDLTPPGLFDRHPGEGHATGCDPHADEAHEGGGPFGFAEYVLLRPRRGAFDYALVDPNRDLVPAGRLEALNYELRSGVRAGLGYRLPDTAWAVGFAYTFLRSGADRTIDAPAGGLIYPTLTRPGLIDNVGFAQATASLEYNLFDVEVSRKVHVDDRLDLTLYAGGRFVTIRQDFESLYDLRDANLARVTTRSNIDGFGPLMGGEATLKVFRGFHLYGRTSAALLSSRLTNPITETNNDGRTTFAAVDYRVRRVVPMLAAGVGAGWEHRNVSVRIGYEMTNLFNAIDQVRLTNDLAEGKLTTRQSDLSLEGLFVRFAVAY